MNHHLTSNHKRKSSTLKEEKNSLTYNTGRQHWAMVSSGLPPERNTKGRKKNTKEYRKQIVTL